MDMTALTFMMIDIQREIAALPTLAGDADPNAVPDHDALSPLQIVAKQGRLLVRLSASADALEARYRELSRQLDTRNAQSDAMAQAQKTAQKETRQMALVCIHLMDALDWVRTALEAQGAASLAREVAAAERDCLRRLAAIGVTEIPCQGLMDAKLHEGVDTVLLSAGDVPRYHIVKTIRRGFQAGPEVLRRASVVTAA